MPTRMIRSVSKMRLVSKTPRPRGMSVDDDFLQSNSKIHTVHLIQWLLLYGVITVLLYSAAFALELSDTVYFRKQYSPSISVFLSIWPIAVHLMVQSLSIIIRSTALRYSCTICGVEYRSHVEMLLQSSKSSYFRCQHTYNTITMVNLLLSGSCIVIVRWCIQPRTSIVQWLLDAARTVYVGIQVRINKLHTTVNHY